MITLNKLSRNRLLEEGFFVIQNVFDAEQLVALKTLCQSVLLPQDSVEYQNDHKSIGSLVNIWKEPGFVNYITSPELLNCFHSLGFNDPRYYYGMVFNKLPHTPQTFWHQDGDNWAHPDFYKTEPLDVILICYLQDATIANGCLRVIPGSHQKRHCLHDALKGTYTPDLRRMSDPGSIAFRSFKDEVSVPVKAGGVVFMDARLLHATHPNTSDRSRTALSLWFHPNYQELPAEIKARVKAEGGLHPFLPADWPQWAKEKLTPLLPPTYTGEVEPLVDQNTPGEMLS